MPVRSPARGLLIEYDMTKDAPPEKFRMTAFPLPATVIARPGNDRLRLMAEFLRFGVVGTIGFLVDAGVLMGALALGLGPWLGRAISYLAAASTTFALNRAWTFRGRGEPKALGRQWALFLLVNLFGFAANYGTYALLITLSALVAANPVIGVAAGSISGLFVNFTLSRRIVFAARSGAGSPSKS